MKLLMTGGNGQLAYDLCAKARLESVDFYAPTREQLSITNVDAIKQIVEQYQPDFIINTAAYTQVDLAEKEAAQAIGVNAQGAMLLAEVCEKHGIPLLHMSTDYVFDGKSTIPYCETDGVSPLNQYGYSKWQGELEVVKHASRAIILRVSAVFGVHGHNFVKTIMRLAEEREELRIVSDQITCPTPAAAIADAIFRMIQSPHWGIYHYCGAPAVSWCDFAKKIIDIATSRLSSMRQLKIQHIIPVNTVEYPMAAMRPSYSVLNCQKIESTYGIMPANWEKGVEDVIAQLYTA